MLARLAGGCFFDVLFRVVKRVHKYARPLYAIERVPCFAVVCFIMTARLSRMTGAVS